MYQKSSSRKNVIINNNAQQPIAKASAFIKQYTPPVLRENLKEWYIEYYAYDPSIGDLKRKKMKINRIKKITERRQYARDYIKRLNDQLSRGWNPWIARQAGDNLTLFNDAVQSYDKFILKMLHDGTYRNDTYIGYKSYLKNVVDFNNNRKVPITYAYQFDRQFCIDVLDHIHIERDNSAQTRNNYLTWLRIFANFCYEKGFISVKPADGLKKISKRLIQKERTVIPLPVIARISEYLLTWDKHFLLACYMLYYCMIRPTELSKLTLACFDLKEGKILISSENSKNRRSQWVTIPKKVLFFAIDLGIFNYPSKYYLFSDGLVPGVSKRDGKIFRDNWAKLKKPLGLKDEWKFYSLKDTGITEMLDNRLSNISVRDQARHSDLSMTDRYTRQAGEKADASILELDGAL